MDSAGDVYPIYALTARVTIEYDYIQLFNVQVAICYLATERI